jgi:hypothetical protein
MMPARTKSRLILACCNYRIESIMAKLDISNTKGRNAEVLYTGQVKASGVQMVSSAGEKPVSRRVVKATRSYEQLLKQFSDAPKLSQALIDADPELDLEITGRYVEKPIKVYLNEQHAVVYKVRLEEQVFDAKGELKETREPKYLDKNITGEHPLKGGKLFAKKQIFNKFIFGRKYQLRHVNGLTYDFLFEIAKDLAEKDCLMMLGSGAKGLLPLVFQDGGTPWRAFVEGRVKEDAYCLILHLTNLELKALPQAEEVA